jgi:hypothetical protein
MNMYKKNMVIVNDFSLGMLDQEFNNKKPTVFSSIKNMLITENGGLVKRPGTTMVEPVLLKQNIKMFNFKVSNKNVLLIASVGSFKIYVEGGQTYNLSTPWNTEQKLETLSFCELPKQEAVYCFSKDFPIWGLFYHGEDSFSLKEVKLLGLPYEDINTLDTTLKIQALEGTNQIVEASVDMFLTTDMGRMLRIAHNGVWGEAKIVAYSSPKRVFVDVVQKFASTEWSKYFSLGAWGKKQGYPSLGVFHGGRLYVCNSHGNCKTIWVSALWNFNDFSPLSTVFINGQGASFLSKENALTINVSALGDILWLCPHQEGVMLGTKNGVYSLCALNKEQIFAYDNHGVMPISDVCCGGAVYFEQTQSYYCDLQKQSIYSLYFEEGKFYQTEKINAHCKNVFKGKIKSIQGLNYPFKMLFILLENGRFFSATKVQNHWAFAEQVFGGNETRVLNFTTAYDGDFSYIWLYVSQNNNGQEVVCLQKLTLAHNYQELDFLDGKQIKPLEGSTVINLFDYEGQYVAAISTTKQYFEPKMVVNNKLTLHNNFNAPEILVGYVYEAGFTLWIESNNLNSLGSLKRINSVLAGDFKGEIKGQTCTYKIEEAQGGYIEMEEDFSQKISLNFVQNDGHFSSPAFIKIGFEICE